MKKKNSIHTLSGILALVLVITLLPACAQNQAVDSCLIGQPYGFWGGLWHGIIAPFGFIGMVIWDNISMYAPNNNGVWYAFGYLLGSGGWGILASKSSK